METTETDFTALLCPYLNRKCEKAACAAYIRDTDQYYEADERHIDEIQIPQKETLTYTYDKTHINKLTTLTLHKCKTLKLTYRETTETPENQTTHETYLQGQKTHGTHPTPKHHITITGKTTKTTHTPTPTGWKTTTNTYP